MQFCPKCDNILDITKNPPKLISLDATTPDTLSSTGEAPNYDNIIKQLLKGKDVEINTINVQALLESKSFSLLSNDDKETIKKKVNIPDDGIMAYNICRNCLFSRKLDDKSLIVSRITHDNTTSLPELSKFKYMIHDKSVPHTRRYVCPNKSCESHKNNDKRDAIWFRPLTDDLLTLYACTSCETVWKAS